MLNASCHYYITALAPFIFIFAMMFNNFVSVAIEPCDTKFIKHNRMNIYRCHSINNRAEVSCRLQSVTWQFSRSATYSGVDMSIGMPRAERYGFMMQNSTGIRRASISAAVITMLCLWYWLGLLWDVDLIRLWAGFSKIIWQFFMMAALCCFVCFVLIVLFWFSLKQICKGHLYTIKSKC